MISQNYFFNQVNRGRPKANYHFTIKGNQPKLLGDLALYVQNVPDEAEYIHTTRGEHGQIETRKIWVTTKLNHDVNFPFVRQDFMIERDVTFKKTNENSPEIVYGITSTDRPK